MQCAVPYHFVIWVLRSVISHREPNTNEQANKDVWGQSALRHMIIIPLHCNCIEFLRELPKAALIMLEKCVVTLG